MSVDHFHPGGGNFHDLGAEAAFSPTSLNFGGWSLRAQHQFAPAHSSLSDVAEARISKFPWE